MKPIKILLMLYLSTAVLFPSYQGYENGQEFHFFGIFETHAEYHHHNRTGIEASHERGHSHSLIHLYHAQRLQRLSPDNGNTHILFISSPEFSTKTSDGYTRILPFLPITPSLIFGKQASGLSPPVS